MQRFPLVCQLTSAFRFSEEVLVVAINREPGRTCSQCNVYGLITGIQAFSILRSHVESPMMPISMQCYSLSSPGRCSLGSIAPIRLHPKLNIIKHKMSFNENGYHKEDESLQPSSPSFMRQSILGGDSNSKWRILPWRPRPPRPSSSFLLIMPPGMSIIIIQNQLLTGSRRPLPITVPIPHRRRGCRHVVQLDMTSAITTNQRRDIRLGVPRKLRTKTIIP